MAQYLQFSWNGHWSGGHLNQFKSFKRGFYVVEKEGIDGYSFHDMMLLWDSQK